MSQWQQVYQLQGSWQEQVSSLYNDSFPMEIRQALAAWIEEQDWDVALTQESVAATLLSFLLAQVEQLCSQEQDFLQRHNFKRILQQMQGKFQASPLHMVNMITCCLREERRILCAANMSPQQVPAEEPVENMVISERQKDIDCKVVAISTAVQEIDQVVKQLQNMQEDFEYRYKMIKSRVAEQGKAGVEKWEVDMLQYALSVLDEKRKEIMSRVTSAVMEIGTLMTSQLAPELAAWKRRQQLACLGGPQLTGEERLQCWFTFTLQSLFLLKRQLDRLEQLIQKVTYGNDPIPHQKPQLDEQVKQLICSLIKSSFVVENQPCMHSQPQKPLVIKVGVHFAAKVRFLLRLPEVDYQLKVITTFDKDIPEDMLNRRFVITNKPKVMDVEPVNGCLAVDFRHMQLKDPSTHGARNAEGSIPVTEELHTLSFEAQLCLQGLSINLETCSLPLVVISNSCQLPSGWASVMWYNLLTDEQRKLGFFSDPPCASWCQLSEALNWQLNTNTGRSLSVEQLDMLHDKLLGPHALHGDCQVSWSMFHKDNLPGKSFSFWEWLDSIVELIKKYLHAIWIDGCIMGFVSKDRELALLKDKEPGTFLLRFSESHLGGITFTWVEPGQNGEAKLNSIEPFTKSILSMRPFADIIHDYKLVADGAIPENPLKFLYPDIPRDEAFGNHYIHLQKKALPYISIHFVPISTWQPYAVPAPGNAFPWMCNSPCSPFAELGALLNAETWEDAADFTGN
nr:signal transducer and activator of transcription 4-like isoform X1 [Paramormyrops kingsleyae]